MQLEAEEGDLIQSVSIILSELEDKLNEYEQGEIKTSDLLGGEKVYNRSTHKFAKLYNQLGDHSSEFVKAVSYLYFRVEFLKLCETCEFYQHSDYDLE